MASEEINTTPDWLTMEMLSNILSLEVMSAHQHVTSQEISVSERIVNITHGPDLVIAHFKQHNPPSTAPVANLREVAFSQLVRQKKNHGICVSMETIAFVQKKCSIHITARDRSNNTGLLRCFFHYDLEEDTDLRSFLPLGSKIIVKEPFCDIIDGQVVLTIEHPCDLPLICNDVTLDMHPSHFSNLKERFQYDETPQAVQNPGSSTKNPENPETDLPHAPFTGPIMLHDFGPKGHGYKATAPIVSGQLLLRERAFATAHQSLDSKTFPVILDHDSETILVGSQARVVSSVLRKLWSSAEGRQDFSLFHHPRATRGQAVPLVDGQPVISSHIVQDVVAFNSFAYSVDSWCEYKKLIPIYPPNRKSHALLRSAGLWVKAAGFNHDCRANAHASFISEDIVIRATRSVNEGDEVTLSYCNPGLSWSARQKKFESTWKFSCHCHRCVSEQGTPSDSSSPSLRTWFRPQSRPSGCQTVSGLDSAAIRILTDSVERDLKAKTRGYLSLANEAQLLFCLMQLAAMQRDATRVQQLACKLLGRHGQRVQISDQASQVINVQPIISGICLEVVSHLLHACSQRNNGIDVSSVQEHAKFLCKIFFGSAHVFSDLHMIVGRCYWQVY